MNVEIFLIMVPFSPGERYQIKVLSQVNLHELKGENLHCSCFTDEF